MRQNCHFMFIVALALGLGSASCNKKKNMTGNVTPPPEGANAVVKDCTDTRGVKHAIGESWQEDRYAVAQSCNQATITCTCESSGEQGVAIAKCPNSYPSQSECITANPPVPGQQPPTTPPPPVQTGEQGNSYPIYGIFDRGAEHLMPSGGYVMDVHYYGEQAGNLSSLYSHPSFANKRTIVRLDYMLGNHSNPTDFGSVSAAFIDKIKGTHNVWGWVIGNEPNLEGVSPEQYAQFLKEAAAAIRANASGKVIMAPVAPGGSNSISYQNTILDIAGGVADAFCLQGKTASAQFPDLGKGGSDSLWSAFLDHRNAISSKQPGKPLIICELGPHTANGSAWGQDPDYLKKAYAELVRLNGEKTHNPIYAGITFRYDADMTPGCQNTDWSFCAHEDVFSNAYSLGLKGPY